MRKPAKNQQLPKPTQSAARRSAGTAARLGNELISASVAGNVSTVRALLAKGAPINFQNQHGETALASAAAWNYLTVAGVLLKHGADPNLADRGGGTALMLAAQHADLELVRELLRASADVNAADRFGNTVLMHALWRERTGKELDAIVRELLNCGAHVARMNQARQSARDIARQRGLTHLERSLNPKVAAA